MAAIPTRGEGGAKRFRNAFVALTLLGVAVGMVGMAFAAVPLYRLFCQVTGYQGTTQRAEAPPDHVVAREIVVRFDANVSELPWRFRPEIPQVTVRLGETATVAFVAENTGARATVGTSTFNVQPATAGVYFNKIECFCFTEQPLEGGQRIAMPVQFFVSPDLAEDPEMAATRTITLSYTFFPAASPGQPVAQSGRDETGKSL
jgi:cytochrome c oxidase assembly protein subunit 11